MAITIGVYNGIELIARGIEPHLLPFLAPYLEGRLWWRFALPQPDTLTRVAPLNALGALPAAAVGRTARQSASLCQRAATDFTVALLKTQRDIVPATVPESYTFP